MRNEVLEFLSNLPEKKSEQFNKAFQLYRMSPGCATRYVQSLNSAGFSLPRLESLLHELKKLHQITDKDILLAAAKTASKASPEQIKEFAAASSNVTMPAFDTGADVDHLAKAVTKETLFPTAPVEVKTAVKLRSEFPFLNDPACPAELKALVTDKFTHYYAYVDAHAALLTIVPEDGKEPVAMTPEEIFELAKAAVENFQANQEIYNELNSYKTSGKILGRHPIFIKMKKQEMINGETSKQLGVRAANLVNYINKKKAEIALSVDPERIALLQGKIEGHEIEQQMVDARLKQLDENKIL